MDTEQFQEILGVYFAGAVKHLEKHLNDNAEKMARSRPKVLEELSEDDVVYVGRMYLLATFIDVLNNTDFEILNDVEKLQPLSAVVAGTLSKTAAITVSMN